MILRRRKRASRGLILLVIVTFALLFRFLLTRRNRETTSCASENNVFSLFIGDDLRSLKPVEQAGWDGAAAWPLANPIITSKIARNFDSISRPHIFSYHNDMILSFEMYSCIRDEVGIGIARSTDDGRSWKYQDIGLVGRENNRISGPAVLSLNKELYLTLERNGRPAIYRLFEKYAKRIKGSGNFTRQWSRTSLRIALDTEVDRWIILANRKLWFWERLMGKEINRLRVFSSKSKNGLPFEEWKELQGSPYSPVAATDGGGLFPFNKTHFVRIGKACFKNKCRGVEMFLTKFQHDVLTQVDGNQSGMLEVEVLDRKGQNVLGKLQGPSGGVLSYGSLAISPSGKFFVVASSVQNTGQGAWNAFVLFCMKIGTLSSYVFGGISYLMIAVYFCSTVKHKAGRVRVENRPIRPKRKSLSFSFWSPETSRVEFPTKGKDLVRVLLFLFRWIFLIGMGFLPITVPAQCEKQRPFFEHPKSLPVMGQYSKFSVLTMSYAPRRKLLKGYLAHYSKCPSAGEIILVWNGPDPPKLEDLESHSKVPFRIRVEKDMSLNNRYKPDEKIKYRSVLSMDDDLFIPCQDIEAAFAEWRQTPNRLVGWFPRFAGKLEGGKSKKDEELTYLGEPATISASQYNMILTGATFMDRLAAFPAYWSNTYSNLRDIVDEQGNCDDMLMNFVMAKHIQRHGSLDLGTVLYMRSSRIIDMSHKTSVGISHNEDQFISKATFCLKKFTDALGNPLVSTHFEWSHHHRRPVCNEARSKLFCRYYTN
eukprot:jgi/Picsp_1/3005/NSC_01227-R1_protein